MSIKVVAAITMKDKHNRNIRRCQVQKNDIVATTLSNMDGENNIFYAFWHYHLNDFTNILHWDLPERLEYRKHWIK